MKTVIKSTVIGLSGAILLGIFTPSLTSTIKADAYTDLMDKMDDGIYGKGNWVDGLDEFKRESGIDDAHKDIPRQNVNLTVHTNVGDMTLTLTGMLNQDNRLTLPDDTQIVSTEPNNELIFHVNNDWSTSYDGHTVTYIRRDGKPLTQKNIGSLIGKYNPSTNDYILPKDQEKTVADGIQVHKIQTITTPQNIDYIVLYAINGTSVNQIKSRALAANTAWYSDKKVTINGEKYYRVATNEWAKANDILHPQDL